METDNQKMMLNSCIKNDFFTCPSCKSEWTPPPLIENEGEEETLIYCYYGCGYLLLENYINQNND
tara:strand:+ start:375 stop:569 length:195 start_codon:yes stop_codon:yes gene_type:complete